MLVAGFNEPHIRNPVTLPSREASLVPFSIEACLDATKQRLIDTFERVDADHRVGMTVDPTGDDRHNAAAGRRYGTPRFGYRTRTGTRALDP